MIHLSSHSLSGTQSVARNGDSFAKHWGGSPVEHMTLCHLMIGFLNILEVVRMRKEVERLRKKYPEGTIVRLFSMTGEPQMQEGLIGTVRVVDDIGSIHVHWENGSTLALIPDEDDFEIVREKQLSLNME